MTSPPELPRIQPGTIWDGVTEYRDDLPSGKHESFLVRMTGDRTRLFSAWRGTLNPMSELRLVTEQLGWEAVGFTYYNTQSFVYVNGYDKSFLAYDGTLTTEAVNQFYLLNQYRAHAARYAHQLDVTMGYNSLKSADEWKRLTVYQTISAMIGVAESKYKIWEAVDPEALIVGGNYDGTLLWKRHLDEYRDVDAKLCGQCQAEELAREFLFLADLPAFRRLYRQGIIYGYDSSTTPWSPELFDVATSPAADYYDQLDANYTELLTYYARKVAAHERSSS